MSETVKMLMQEIAPVQNTPHNKVTIVGVGQVGMVCAYSILQQNIASEICLIGVLEDKLKSEMINLQRGLALNRHCHVMASTDYKVSAGSKVCVITAGCRQREGESRLSLVQRNVEIFKGIVPQLVKYSPDTLLLVVSNSVDVLTYVTWKLSGLPKERVFGSGTNLDSARFRFLLSERLGIAPSNCHGWIIGEHGDSSVAVWSGVNVAGVTLSNMNPEIGHRDENDHWEEGIHQKVIQSAYEGVHGIAHDVYLSLPSVLGANGLTHIVKQNILPKEREQLHKSAEQIAKIFADFQQFEKDSRIAYPMIVPVSCGTIGHDIMMAGLEDCAESELEIYDYHFGVEHLKECDAESLAALKFPVKGMVCLTGERFVLPLKVSAPYEGAKPHVVFFILDTGALNTNLTANTIAKVFGQRRTTPNVLIQDRLVPFCRSAWGTDEKFAKINLIGSSFMQSQNLSLVVSPHRYRDPAGQLFPIFYLTTFDTASDALKMADIQVQTADVTKRALVRYGPHFSSSNPLAGAGKIVSNSYLVPPPVKASAPSSGRDTPSSTEVNEPSTSTGIGSQPAAKQARLDSDGKTEN